LNITSFKDGIFHTQKKYFLMLKDGIYFLKDGIFSRFSTLSKILSLISIKTMVEPF